MTRYLLATLLCALFGVGAAHAQPAPSGLDGGWWAGGACNVVTFSGPNGPYTLMVNSHGALCVDDGGGGGGGGAITAPIGPNPSSASVSVTMATDQTPIKVTQPDVQTSGSVAAQTLNSNYPLTLGGGVQSIYWQVTGLTGTGAVLTVLGSTDASTYTVTLPHVIQPQPVGAPPTTSTADGSFCTNVGALTNAKMNVSTSGSSATVTINATASVSQCPALTPQLGGSTPTTILTAASNNSTSIKNTPGTLTSVTWVQTSTTLMDIRFYDTASAPTCSSATGMKINFPAQSNAVSPGGSINLGPFGVNFANGIGVCITGGNANNDNTNAATGLNLILGYN